MSTTGSLWQMQTARPALDPAEVHVWRVELDLPAAALARLRASLSPDEQARAARFCAAVHRARFAAGRGVLRAILGAYLGLEPAALRFAYGPQGKPALEPDLPPLEFNLAHSGSLALLAVARGRRVGVDVERFRPDLNEPGMAAMILSAREQAALAALPAARRAGALLEAWTRKEAYLKARGGGLTLGMERFEVAAQAGAAGSFGVTAPEPAEAAEAGHWSVRALDPGPGYAGAVAAEGHDWRPVLWQWPAAGLE